MEERGWKHGRPNPAGNPHRLRSHRWRGAVPQKTVGFIMGGKIRRRRVARERAERKQVYLFPESIITGQPVIDDGNRRRKNPDPVAVAQMESRMKPLPVQYQGQVFFFRGQGLQPFRTNFPEEGECRRIVGRRVLQAIEFGCLGKKAVNRCRLVGEPGAGPFFQHGEQGQTGLRVHHAENENAVEVGWKAGGPASVHVGGG